MGIGFKPSCIKGITFVDHVIAENPIESPLFIFPKFKSACTTAKFAELPLFTITQYFLPCHLEKALSNLIHCSPMLNCEALDINLQSLFTVSFSL